MRHICLLIFLLVSIAANAAPTVDAFGVRIDTVGKVYPGKVLFVDCATRNPDAFAQAYLIGEDGNVVKSWKSGSLQWLAKPNGKDGSIIVLRKGSNPIGTENCSAPTDSLWLSKVDANNTPVNIYRDPHCGLTHDFEVLPDGTYLILCQALITNTSISTQPFLDNIIRRVDGSGKVLWSWSTADHYSQLALSEQAHQIIMAGQTYYQAPDVTGPPSEDVFHTNNIQFIPANASAASNPAFRAGNILVDQRNTNLIFAIDYATGNIAWQIGHISIGQHNARIIPAGLPGDGHILLLDNGGYAGYPAKTRLYSQVVEYDPIAAKVVWNWTQARDTKDITVDNYAFQTFYRGSTQRLPNGNTFIDEATWGRFIEVDPAGSIVWEYVKEFGNPTPNRNAKDRHIYRAYKVASCWPGCQPEPGFAGQWTW